jgi:phytanoyl-CoA hydroxylase
MMERMFSDIDTQHYAEHGYVVARGLFESAELERFDERVRGLIEDDSRRDPRIHVVKDVMVAKGVVKPETELHAVNKLMGFEDDPVLGSYVVDKRVTQRVERLIGPGLMSIASNVINKPPGVDGRHPLHQDLAYFPLRPADRLIGVWTALGPATRENGCLAVVPGSHRGELRKHSDPKGWKWVNFAFWGAEGAPVDERVHLEMEAGDTVFFHSLLLHGSGHNRTDSFRRAIAAHYARADCERLPGMERMQQTFRRLG